MNTDSSLEKTVIPAQAGIQLRNKFPCKWDNTLGFVCFAELFLSLDSGLMDYLGLTGLAKTQTLHDKKPATFVAGFLTHLSGN